MSRWVKKKLRESLLRFQWSCCFYTNVGKLFLLYHKYSHSTILERILRRSLWVQFRFIFLYMRFVFLIWNHNNDVNYTNSIIYISFINILYKRCLFSLIRFREWRRKQDEKYYSLLWEKCFVLLWAILFVYVLRVIIIVIIIYSY